MLVTVTRLVWSASVVTLYTTSLLPRAPGVPHHLHRHTFSCRHRFMRTSRNRDRASLIALDLGGETSLRENGK